ncbi:MAG: hypothetical protein RRY53_06290 [Pseudoflavonifractor sp.]
MKRIRAWLYTRFLPTWCKDDLLDRNARLLDEVAELKRENQRLHAYIGGMQEALRHGSRVNIHTEGVKP